MPNDYKYDLNEPMRLNKYLAQIGVCSRRKAEELIETGAISVNGQRVTELGAKLTSGDIVQVNETGTQKLAAQFSVLYHKPVGIVSGQAQKGEIPATACLRPDRKFGGGLDLPPDITMPPVGRLDKDSRGLLILSQDGILVRHLISPHNEIDKEYEVVVDGVINDDKIRRLRFGLTLDGRALKRAQVELIAPQRLRFVLREGRNRQIRRMCEKVGLNVVDLFRVRIGKISLGELPEGNWRHLSQTEIGSIKPK